MSKQYLDKKGLETLWGKIKAYTVFVKGDADNSAVLKNLNNTAISEGSIALGNSNIAGLKGWYYGSINKIDDRTIDVYISDSQRGVLNYPTWGGTTKISNLNPYEVLGNNTVVSLINDVKYDNKFKVIDGEAGRIRLQTVSGNLPFSSIATEFVLDPEDYSIYCLSKPDAGVADVSLSSIAEGRSTKALGACSHAEGYNTTASGKYSHVEGRDTEALYIAHAEGSQTKALGNASHAEGTSTQALNSNSHAEGFETEVKGYAGHAEGKGTKVLSDYGHSEGELTEVSVNSNSAHAEGIRTKASNTAAHAEGRNTIAAGVYAHAEGYNDDNNVDYGAFGAISHTEGYATVTTSTANSGHAEGRFTTVSGMGAHAEGISNTASGEAAHVEGKYTKATGYAAHAEGYGESLENPNLAQGDYSHVEGEKTQALGMAAHAEGGSSVATGNFSHSEGRFTRAHALCSHAEGFSVEGKEDEYGAFGPISHVEGYANTTTSTANSAHAEGRLNTVSGMGAHVEGISNIASGEASHAEGSNTTAAGPASHAEGLSSNKANIEEGDDPNTIKEKWKKNYFSLACGAGSHVEGKDNLALGNNSHAEGAGTTANGLNSHAEGTSTSASGFSSHAEGYNTTAAGVHSHAEGVATTAAGDHSHAEGSYTTAGSMSHAEGSYTTASGYYSHAEGGGTTASGEASHAEGYKTTASGYYSHAEGWGTRAYNHFEHAEGKYNKSNDNTIHSVGIGADNDHRKNAHEIMDDGKHYIYNIGGYDGTNPNTSHDLATYLPNMVNITYDELVALRSDSKLVPGQQYRITDYVTTTTQSDTQSAGHQFDIIVVADDVNVLNENARAIQHEEDTYFADSDLSAWELKYCLDNDTSRFAWAAATNGKGVIYYMKDEFNNECPYDFKNIQFARWKLSNPVGYRNDYDFDNYEDNWVEESTPFDSLKTGFYGLTGSDNVFKYVYNDDNEDYAHYKYKVEYTISESPTYCYTFGKDTDYSMNGNNYGNIIKEYKSSKPIRLNNIVFFGNGCHNNSFGNDCHNNSFGNDCHNNSFGNGCYDNSFREYCYSNSFGDGCSYNSFGRGCDYNSFGNNCSDNSFGNSCSYNSFGNSCSNNSFGTGCSRNSFGDDCYGNSFGNNCSYNSFGNNCSYNSFGNGCSGNSFGESSSNLKSYYHYIIFDNGNRYINLNCTSTTSSSKYFQNVRIGLGVNNTTTYKTINDSNVGQTYETLYKPANSQTITI